MVWVLFYLYDFKKEYDENKKQLNNEM